MLCIFILILSLSLISSLPLENIKDAKSCSDAGVRWHYQVCHKDANDCFTTNYYLASEFGKCSAEKYECYYNGNLYGLNSRFEENGHLFTCGKGSRLSALGEKPDFFSSSNQSQDGIIYDGDSGLYRCAMSRGDCEVDDYGTDCENKGINSSYKYWNSSLQDQNKCFGDDLNEKTEVLISFRIDDIDFSSGQEISLKKASYLAEKYNITFDLGVIAQRFYLNKNETVFQIYKDNSDVFEIVAHGYTHRNPITGGSGEFYDVTNKKPIPENIQEWHIQEMKNIFEKYDLNLATKIFFVPWHKGDENTIKIAEQYGYKLMTQTYVPENKENNLEYNNKNIIVSYSVVNIPLKEWQLEKDISNSNKQLNDLINSRQENIQIVMHYPNFYKDANVEDLIKNITQSSYSQRVKFGFVSERLD